MRTRSVRTVGATSLVILLFASLIGGFVAPDAALADGGQVDPPHGGPIEPPDTTEPDPVIVVNPDDDGSLWSTFSELLGNMF